MAENAQAENVESMQEDASEGVTKSNFPYLYQPDALSLLTRLGRHVS